MDIIGAGPNSGCGSGSMQLWLGKCANLKDVTRNPVQRSLIARVSRLRKVAKSAELMCINRRQGANGTLWWMFWGFCWSLWCIVQEFRMEPVDTRPYKNCSPASNATCITDGVA